RNDGAGGDWRNLGFSRAWRKREGEDKTDGETQTLDRGAADTHDGIVHRVFVSHALMNFKAKGPANRDLSKTE
ncbi:MAG: hypothetical protein ACREPG_02145, partial [Candidatus Binatia bacterium]